MLDVGFTFFVRGCVKVLLKEKDPDVMNVLKIG